MAAGAVNIALASSANAATDNWIGGTSDWNTPSNWDTDTVPGAGDTVNIINTDGTSPTIDYDYNGPAVTLFSLTIDNTAGVDTLSMQTAGLALTSNGETVGNTGTGAFFQAAGQNTLMGSGAQLLLAASAGSSGAYTLQDGTLSFTDVFSTESIAPAGSATFTQTGGMNSITTNGSQELIGAFGHYIQSGGINTAAQLNIYGGNYSLSSTAALSMTGSENVDFGGTFNQNGGSNAVTSSVLVGAQASSVGTYTMTDGTLSAGFATFVGYAGTGTFVQTGGTATVADLAVGFLAASSGTYTLGPAGSLSVSATALLGFDSTGSFIQTGGTNVIGNSLYLGYNPTGDGSYTQSSGTLSGAAEYIGNSGSGSFNQSGGVNFISAGNALYLGYNPGATGTYTLCATGTLTAMGSEYVAYGNTGPAFGSFTQTGGLNTLAGTSGNLSVGVSSGSTGSYILNDGTLALMGSVTAENVGLFGTGTFTQTGGMNYVTGSGEYVGLFNGSQGIYNQSGGVNDLAGFASNLYIGYNPGANGQYNISNGTLSAVGIIIGGNATGAGGTGSLTVTGNGQMTASSLYLSNTTGSFINVTGGSLAANFANLNGPLMQSGGSISFRNIAGSGQLSITGGTTTITPYATGPSHLASLNISGGGTLDLTTDSLVIQYAPGPDPIAQIVSYITRGYNGGAWTGAGLTSSSAAATPGKFALGYLDSTDPGGAPNQILVKYTLAGDANLDGNVDFTDLGIVGQHLNTLGNDWANGNFTYAANGLVNFTDLGIVGQNLNQTSNDSLQMPSNTLPLVQTTALQVQNTAVQLPEPASLALVAAGASLLARRRRDRRPTGVK